MGCPIGTTGIMRNGLNAAQNKQIEFQWRNGLNVAQNKYIEFQWRNGLNGRKINK
ncbi:hypothetical protein FACS189452_09580 [Bacteroidia bacterium]|nr:hypothetical protein FACS189452_09580 [Bacteroidia bacterium]